MHLSRACWQAIETKRQTDVQAEDVKHQSEKAADKVGDAAGNLKDKVGPPPSHEHLLLYSLPFSSATASVPSHSQSADS